MAPKTFVSIIAAIIVICSATVITMYVTNVGTGKLVPQSIRFVLTCLLAFSLIRGWFPGRWITVALMGLAGIGSIIGGITILQQRSAGVFMLGLGLVYTACVIGLLTPIAGAHFKPRRNVEQDAAPKH